MQAIDIYQGSDGKATVAFYEDLSRKGVVGEIAVCLFRAAKASARAKVYRGGIRGKGSFKGMAYDKKNWSMQILCEKLSKNWTGRWGWKQDPIQEFHSWVLYVDIPQGQVSFHSASRGIGPDYPGDWDGEHRSAERIIEFCDQVLRLKNNATEDPGQGQAVGR